MYHEKIAVRNRLRAFGSTPTAYNSSILRRANPNRPRLTPDIFTSVLVGRSLKLRKFEAGRKNYLR
jgi:hypothetical protein